MGEGKILVVEGNREIRESLERMFQEEGFEVFSAENAGVAFDMLRACQPDLILTDLIMPLVAGEDFIKTLKRVQQFAAIPIVVLTAHCHVFGKEAKAAGATEVLCKSRDLPIVIETVKKLLGNLVK